jgi:NitT/TauT family transport system permease protein
MAVAASAVAAVLALSIHALLPTRQEVLLAWLRRLPSWQHPYTVLLEILLATSVLAGAMQWWWRSLRPWVMHYGPLLVGALVVVCLWDLITAKLDWMEQPYFPGPDEVLGGLIDDTFRAAAVTLWEGGNLNDVWNALTEKGILLVSTFYSLGLLSCGYLAGVAAGLVTGVLIGWFPRFRYWGMPVLKIVGPIPATALVPLAMMISKETYPCAVALIGFAVWFPVSMLTASGIANVRLSYLDVARTLGAGRLYLIFRVAIPSALPNIFIGLFMGLGASFLTLIVAETLGVKAGLGWYLLWRKGVTEYAKVYACLIIMALFFSTLMTLLFKLRDWVLKWQKGVIKW